MDKRTALQTLHIDIGRFTRINDPAVATRLFQQELKDRYRELSKRHHPDLGGEKGKMRELNEAYSFLMGSRFRRPRSVITIRGIWEGNYGTTSGQGYAFTSRKV